jgi:acetyl esterase
MPTHVVDQGATMALEPRVQRLVRVMNKLDRSDGQAVSMAERRAASAAMSRRFKYVVMRRGPKDVTSTDHLVPVQGGRIMVRVHRPPTTGPLPLHVFFHGGGWCVGTVDERDPKCRAIAAGAGCAVASVDYRMAPENTFPTAPEDCYEALCWLHEHADELGIDPTRIAVGGESAGGNLAAVVCLMARDRSGPAIRYQWLDVPATDLTMTQPSITDTPPGLLLDHAAMVEFRANYLTDVDAEVYAPYASPLHANDHRGLPEAWILTCGYDPLRDDGRAYVDKLRAAGVEVQHTHLDGHVHPSFSFTRLVPSAREYEQQAIAALATALHA